MTTERETTVNRFKRFSNEWLSNPLAALEFARLVKIAMIVQGRTREDIDNWIADEVQTARDLNLI